MARTSIASPVVDNAALQQYQANGFVIVRQVFSIDEMAALSEEANRLFEKRDLIDVDNLRCRWQNHVETNECRFDCFDPIIDLSDTFARAARDERLFEIVSCLYGEAACLFKDKLIYKPPGATGYGLHQDYISWPSFPKSFVTLLLPIDPANDANGATEIFPGSHRKGYLSALDGDYHELPLSEVDETKGVRLNLEPGDVAVFHGMLPHRSAANRSQTWRRQLYLSYNAQSDGGDQRDAHYREFHVWLEKKYAEYGKHGVYFK
jgi:ectoine hydroxylase-related dioxygenase (phytanoyl-CoA dioxygenase family)